jgi:hypothetical protein
MHTFLLYLCLPVRRLGQKHRRRLRDLRKHGIFQNVVTFVCDADPTLLPLTEWHLRCIMIVILGYLGICVRAIGIIKFFFYLYMHVCIG